ncbi:hypothetical protein Fmac_010073 [Flemingia macrophylla]|uniref:Uncharacterized protein n=1 Tax=Flemingia macrophylla TaxID=520843 RepID=A0ABD1N203_9FABA
MKLLESKKRTEAGAESPENPSGSVPPQKKTRDLPNLTECHACGFKVDVCTGRNRLRPLYSEWRVVLLCNKCFSSVQSSKMCSYCFSEASPQSFRCNQCGHSVHESCFLKHRNAAPWSYACAGNEFSVCVDCWIPKHVAISRRRKAKLKGGENGRVMLEKGNSRVFQSIEDTKRAVVEEKVEVAARAREGAKKKDLVANNALISVANREEPSKIDAFKVLDGSELTFELHPHLNSLPRVSKSCCILNTSYLELGTPKRGNSSVGSSSKTSNSGNDAGCDEHDTKLLEDSCKSLCEPSVSVGSLDSGSSTDLNLLCMGMSGMVTGSKDGDHPAEFGGEGVGEELVKEGEGSCSGRLINFSEDSGVELDRKQADSALHREEPCNGLPDRYFLKYSRRNCSLKPNLGSNPKSC